MLGSLAYLMDALLIETALSQHLLITKRVVTAEEMREARKEYRARVAVDRALLHPELSSLLEMWRTEWRQILGERDVAGDTMRKKRRTKKK
jgi:hypothetical protein